jgi:large subunit ribosomal protein L7/L12
MADISKEQVVDYLSKLPVMEIANLVKELEDKWGVKAAAGGGVMMAAGPAAGGAAPDAAPEATSFDVILKSFPEPKKINVIKALRALIQGLGLKEAKTMAESAPTPVKEGISKAEAEEFVKALKEAGAEIDVKAAG